MVIVGNSVTLRNFKNIKEFKIDLGESITKEENLGDSAHPNFKTVIKLTDPFVKKYFNMFGNYTFKHGKIGSLSVYSDDNMRGNMLSFYEGDNIYDVDYKGGNFRSFLNFTLDDIMEKEKDHTRKMQYVNKVPEGPIKTKDMSQDELIDHLLKKRESQK